MPRAAKPLQTDSSDISMDASTPGCIQSKNQSCSVTRTQLITDSSSYFLRDNSAAERAVSLGTDKILQVIGNDRKSNFMIASLSKPISIPGKF